MKLKTRIQLVFWRLKDSVRYSKRLRSLNAIRLFLISFCKSDATAAEMLSRALGFSENAWLGRKISSSLNHRFPPESNIELWSDVVRALPRYRDMVIDDPKLTRSIILKAPGEGGEKGVLLLYFEYNWVRLVLGIPDADFEEFENRFDLILSTSWSPTDYAALALCLAKTKGPMFLQSCNYSEAGKLAGFHPRVVVLDSLPCDWINSALYTVKSHDRPIDFLMVANWGKFKRHFEFFIALRTLPESLRVVLVGQKEGGRDSDFIRDLAKRLNVPQKLEIHESISIEKVAELQEAAKVSLIFSRREGCCVAAVESLFAGCALGLRADAHVGPLQYINERTGMQLRPGNLAEDLLRLLEVSATVDPAAWAREHISCFITHEKLNQKLGDSVRERGLPWTRNLVIPQWRPYPCYVSLEDAEAMRPAYDDLHEKCKKVFPAYDEFSPN